MTNSDIFRSFLYCISWQCPSEVILLFTSRYIRNRCRCTLPSYLKYQGWTRHTCHKDIPTSPSKEGKWYSSVSYLIICKFSLRYGILLSYNILYFVVIYCNIIFFFSFSYTASRPRIFFTIVSHIKKIKQTVHTSTQFYTYPSCLLAI